jgi:hypothetical protein
MPSWFTPPFGRIVSLHRGTLVDWKPLETLEGMKLECQEQTVTYLSIETMMGAIVQAKREGHRI